MTGFQTFTRANVPVTLNSVARVEAALSVSQLQEAVMVSAERPMLQTDRAEVREELGSRELSELPVSIGTELPGALRTVPGVTPPEDAHSVPSNPSRALDVQRQRLEQPGNNTRIDGVSSTNVWLPHVVAYMPALESIETVNVVTNNFDAEQGLAGGAAISVQIKSGTNRYPRLGVRVPHQREDAWPKNYFTPPGTNKGKWRDDQFGGTHRRSDPPEQAVLFRQLRRDSSAQERPTDDFGTDRGRAARRLQRGPATTIHDPFTGSADGTGRTPFAGNVIPADRISPVAAKILQFFPLPNLRAADGSIPEMNNYFVQPRFIFNRWTVDSKVNWNASSRLQVFGRYSQLDFYQDNETVLGPQLQGNPGAGGNPGVGWGDTYNFSAGADLHAGQQHAAGRQRRLGPNGQQRRAVGSEREERARVAGHPRDEWPESLGGRAAVHRSRRLRGRRHDRDLHAVLPQRRSVSGGRQSDLAQRAAQYPVRLGHVFHRAESHPAGNRRRQLRRPRRVQLQCRPDAAQGRPGRHELQQLRGIPARPAGRSGPSEAERRALHDAELAVQLLRARPVAGPSEHDVVVRYALRVPPDPTRADRGLERYNLDTNMMEIGGLGGVPKDLGIPMQKNLFSPRLGVTYRMTNTAVLRGGFGITNDPYSLARPMRTNHPILLNVVEEAEHSFTWLRPIEQGIPSIPDPDLGSGIIPVPGNVTVVTLPKDFKRGRVESWNVAFEKELKWGFVGEAAYVGTRQVNQLGVGSRTGRRLAAAATGRQLVQTVRPDRSDAAHRSARQLPLQRRCRHAEPRFQKRRSGQRQLHAVESDRDCGAPNSDNQPRVDHPRVLPLEHGHQRHRPHARAEHQRHGRTALRARAAMV